MSALPRLKASDFAAFFKALHGFDPFPWQQRLLEGLVADKWLDAKYNPQQWPAAMALPTASGKTACIDIALFHLALQADSPPDKRTAPRRIFFCVDRRVIVDEAYDRARRIAAKLACAVGQRACDDCRNGAGGSKCARDGPLQGVASRLRQLAGGDTAPPLAVFQLRGGVFRDNAWAASPLQPTVICTTVDQLGSRLLFRGYGVSPHSASIHAGLAANDALILLDEAHCAEPFRQTLDAVRLFRGEEWCDAAHAIRTPFAFVEMSATPRSSASPFELDRTDRERAELSQRLNANKQALLRLSNHATATAEFAKELATQAKERIQAGSKRIAVMVNRVDTARRVHDELRRSSDLPAGQAGWDAILMIGRMRPLDRDDLVRQWQPKLKATPGTEARDAHDRPIVVVATQCLEVGANLDFDALITEAASLDALRQRFGRLNRLGRDAQCSAVIVAPNDAVAKDADDPIYGPAITRTWDWLQNHAAAPTAETDRPTDATAAAGGGKPKRTSRKKSAASETTKAIKFGIAALNATIAADPAGRECFAPAPDAPVMLPAHLDLWCQTAPIPDPDPDVSIFLHGPQRGVPTVSVCWRADLGDDRDQWAEIVSLLPPSSPECMPVPLHLIRRWMQDKPPEAVEDTGDVEEAAGRVEDDNDHRENHGQARYVLRWTGPPRNDHSQTRATNDPNDVRPGDVIVIPAALAATCTFGHLPGVPCGQPLSGEARASLDRAEHANLIARRRLALRLTTSLVESWPDPRDDAHQPLLPARTKLLTLLRNADTCLRLGEPDVAEQIKAGLHEFNRELRAAAKAGRIGPEWAPLRVLAAATATRALRSEVLEHPAGGFVVRSRRRIGERALRAAGLLPGEIESGFDDEDESSFATARPVTLADHVVAVANRARTFADACGIATVADAVYRAAMLHDHGKLDPRWQGMIRGGQPPARVVGLPPLAKGNAPLRTWPEQHAAARRAGLPPGFRHEMLSMQIAEHAQCEGDRPLLDGLPDELRDLVLHLIASHHGHARPLAPVVIDESPQPLPRFKLETDGHGDNRSVLPAPDASRRAECQKLPAHRLDSGVCDRFWTLTRRYGWWGLAYLEAILRLADRAVSREEQENAERRPGMVRASRPQAPVSGGPGR